MVRTEPSGDNQFLVDHVQLLRSSYERLTGKTFGPPELTGPALAQAIYHAPYVVLSHGTEPDPIFNYGNLCAQQLFAMTWTELCQFPSRRSAESPNQAARQRLLDAVTSQGFMENYQGIRIAKDGRRFWIKDVTVWNLMDEEGVYHGQGAIYSRWEDIVDQL